jgi:hypothetical protein
MQHLFDEILRASEAAQIAEIHKVLTFFTVRFAIADGTCPCVPAITRLCI